MLAPAVEPGSAHVIAMLDSDAIFPMSGISRAPGRMGGECVT
jgi:hypothetical protein